MDGVDELRRALAIRPHAADLYSDLGAKLSSLGDRRAAAEAYAQAIRLAPRHAVAYNNLAGLVAGSAQKAEALRLYLAAYELQPGEFARFPQMHLNLAGQLVDAGRYRDAIWHLARSLGWALCGEWVAPASTG